MTMKALGLIEAIGLNTAIVAADAAVKSANVVIIGYENGKGGGRVTVKLMGDVGAVRAAISAGEAAGGMIGKIESAIVIARPANEIEALVKIVDQGIGFKEFETPSPVIDPPPSPVESVVGDVKAPMENTVKEKTNKVDISNLPGKKRK